MRGFFRPSNLFMKQLILAFFFNVTLLFISCKESTLPVVDWENIPNTPAPYGATPTPEQIAWQKLEYYMFVHFGPNTFTDMEWGSGLEDPKVFYPTSLDCRQWVYIAKQAGMKAIIFTAKHHDGFCLWPSNYSSHTVRESDWKDGKGDVLKELSDACREYNIKLGIYLSPWDRNHPTYGSDEYNRVFKNTLTEALGNYGNIFEQWFDGANGEGPNGKVQVYDWELFDNTVYELQPQAVIFGGLRPTVRWAGNEKGYAGETNWSTYTYGKKEFRETGIENGEVWSSAECDVSIRPGWFYSSSTDDKVKTLEQLMDIYFTSVGRNATLLLNVPPDRRGLIHPNDSARLMEVREVIDKTFQKNLLTNAKISADSQRDDSKYFIPERMIDGIYDSYWATPDNQLTAVIELELKKEESFDCLMLQEYIPLGQRVKAFSVEYRNGNEWVLIDSQTTIGYKRLLRFPVVTAKKIRINIEKSLACPTINNIGLYKVEL